MQGKIRQNRAGAGAKALALGISLAAFAPMAETAVIGKAASAQSQAKYNPSINPIAPVQKAKDIAGPLSGTGLEMARQIFDKLRSGAPQGVKAESGKGRAPRTAAETIEKGGDCTEFASLAVSLLDGSGAKGGVLVVHFASSPAEKDHMVPFVFDGKGRKIILDLQAGELGSTKQGKYSVVMEMTFAQAASMYHREWGDHLRDSKKPEEAVAAYAKALSIFQNDAYVHQNIGILYEKAGKMQDASKHFKRAAELDPKYARDRKRGSYNEELQAGENASNSGKWAECAEHFQAALDSGEKIPKEERKIIEGFRDDCRGKIGQ